MCSVSDLEVCIQVQGIHSVKHIFSLFRNGSYLPCLSSKIVFADICFHSSSTLLQKVWMFIVSPASFIYAVLAASIVNSNLLAMQCSQPRTRIIVLNLRKYFENI